MFKMQSYNFTLVFYSETVVLYRNLNCYPFFSLLSFNNKNNYPRDISAKNYHDIAAVRTSILVLIFLKLILIQNFNFKSKLIFLYKTYQETLIRKFKVVQYENIKPILLTTLYYSFKTRCCHWRVLRWEIN